MEYHKQMVENERNREKPSLFKSSVYTQITIWPEIYNLAGWESSSQNNPVFSVTDMCP